MEKSRDTNEESFSNRAQFNPEQSLTLAFTYILRSLTNQPTTSLPFSRTVPVSPSRHGICRPRPAVI